MKNARLCVGGTASPPDFVDWRRDSTSFVEMAAINAGAYALTGSGPAEQVPGATVTGGFFAVLGVTPLYGRALAVDDDAIGGPNVAVLGHALWTRRFGGDPQAVGRTITIDADEYRIVGVMPRGFSYPLQSELWLPQRFTADRSGHPARRALPGRDRAAETGGVARSGARGDASDRRAPRRGVSRARTATTGSRFTRCATRMVGDVRTPLLLLTRRGRLRAADRVRQRGEPGADARARAGRRELAIRTALGAGRVRLVRGVLVESVVLSLAGAIAGLVFAIWATRAISALESGLGIPLLGGDPGRRDRGGIHDR